MSDSETIEVYNRQVDDYVAMTENLEEEESVAAFVSLVKPAGKLLDLGCGPGNTAAYFQSLKFTVDAVDASAEMLRVAKSQFGVEARCAGFLDIDAEDEYDGVWANFSLLHASVSEFPVILSALYRATKPGGAFHIGMKTGEGAARDGLGRLYTYYSTDELQSALETAGFSVVDVQHGEGKGLAGTVDQWVVILSKA